MIVTSTNQIEGCKIIKYIGVVSSHLVAGTGLFSDMAAEVRDIIGGRSKSYQNQLDDLDKGTIRLLQEKALLLKANGILGLKIDYDEVSGKGKSMLMANAIGTAVVLEMDFSAESNPLNTDLDFLKNNIAKKKKYEAKATIICEGVNTESELIQILDREIEEDSDFYQYLLTHHKLRANPLFINALDTHRKIYQDNKDKTEIETRKNKRTAIEDELSQISDAIKNLSSVIQNCKISYQEIVNDEAQEERKIFSKDIHKIIYAYSSLKSKSNDIIHKCNSLLNTFSKAIEYSIVFDVKQKDVVDKLLIEAKQITMDANAKEATLRIST
ncbi:MAG: heavy metal-binding domain-containing protein [Ignavibacteriaceae bacterium]|jgi:uncharacterized protein YbjQ (UPF0145 family)